MNPDPGPTPCCESPAQSLTSLRLIFFICGIRERPFVPQAMLRIKWDLTSVRLSRLCRCNKNISAAQPTKPTPTLVSRPSQVEKGRQVGSSSSLRGSERWTPIPKVLPQFQRLRKENTIRHVPLPKPAQKGYPFLLSTSCCSNEPQATPNLRDAT